jgi:hypothetical protein
MERKTKGKKVENRQKDEHVEEWRQEENKSRSVHKHK